MNPGFQIAHYKITSKLGPSFGFPVSGESERPAWLRVWKRPSISTVNCHGCGGRWRIQKPSLKDCRDGESCSTRFIVWGTRLNF